MTVFNATLLPAYVDHVQRALREKFRPLTMVQFQAMAFTIIRFG